MSASGENWCPRTARKAEEAEAESNGLSSDEHARLEQLERENGELRRVCDRPRAQVHDLRIPVLVPVEGPRGFAVTSTELGAVQTVSLRPENRARQPYPLPHEGRGPHVDIGVIRPTAVACTLHSG